MQRTSVIVPARNEQFLNPTIRELLNKAAWDLEIIVILDGHEPDELVVDPNVHYIRFNPSRGMRAAINAGVAIATGKYIMKIDAHCMVGEEFDVILANDCEDNWVSVPRRHRLDAENWCIQEVKKPPIDYMFLSYPSDPDDFGGPGLNGKLWDERNKRKDLKEKLIDDLMSAQGSCWFMHRDYFYELELMDEVNYGPFWNEFQEIGLKCWLSGGRVIRNKKTWYAHLHKGKKYGRGYFISKTSLTQAATFTKNWMKFGKAWDKQTLPLSWLIEKFAPVPGWPDDWKE